MYETRAGFYPRPMALIPGTIRANRIRCGPFAFCGCPAKSNQPYLMKQHQRLTGAIMAAVFTAGSAWAGPAPVMSSGKEPPPPPPKETDWCDSVWGLATLYKNKDNPYIQEFSLLGRYHGQYWTLDGDQNNEDDWDHRRFRYGAKMVFLHDFEFKFEAFGDLNVDDWYSGFTELNVAWKPNEQFNLQVGKQKAKYSLDFSTSSREILTIERNILINNLGIDFQTGASISGKQGKWSYYAGAFSNDVRDSDSTQLEFGDLDGGWSYIASLAYDVKEQLGTEKGVVRLDYIHMQHDDDLLEPDEFLTRFDDSLALSLNVKQGKWGLITEGLWASGDNGDIWGFYVMPTYDITKKLQAVARYTHGGSGDDLLRPGRYEREFNGNASGEEYNAGYLGLTYYICGHKLKLMTGIEYAEMDGGAGGVGDFEGWTWTSGLRLYF